MNYLTSHSNKKTPARIIPRAWNSSDADGSCRLFIHIMTGFITPTHRRCTLQTTVLQCSALEDKLLTRNDLSRLTNYFLTWQIKHTKIRCRPLCSGRGKQRGSGRRGRKNPDTQAEEQPDYKSFNCNQKGHGPSATALLLFHCSLS